LFLNRSLLRNCELHGCESNGCTSYFGIEWLSKMATETQGAPALTKDESLVAGGGLPPPTPPHFLSAFGLLVPTPPHPTPSHPTPPPGSPGNPGSQPASPDFICIIHALCVDLGEHGTIQVERISTRPVSIALQHLSILCLGSTPEC